MLIKRSAAPGNFSVERPLFIVSAPCAGTSPIFELLSRARHVCTLNNASRNELRTRLEANDITAEEIRSLVRDGLQGRGQIRWLSAIVANAKQIPLLNEAYPDAVFIYVHRDASEQLARMTQDGHSESEWSETTSRIMNDLAALPSRRWCAIDLDGFLKDRPREAALLGKFAGISWRVRPGPAQRAGRRPSAAKTAPVLPDLARDAAIFAQANHASLRDLPEESFWQTVKALPENVAKAVVSSRLAAGLAIGAGAVPVVAIASTLTVTSAADTGDAGELRTEIAAANPGDTITFDSSLNGHTITLQAPIKVTTTPLTIQGPGSGELTIDGNAQPAGTGLDGGTAIFYLYAFTPVDGGSPIPGTVTISGVTLQHGNSRAGGAILDIIENLTLSDVTVRDNHASGPGGGIAIGPYPSFTMQNSTITGNTADEKGGGLALYGTSGGVLLDHVQVTNNISLYHGGGIYATRTDGGVFTIENSTIAGNSAGDPDAGTDSYGGGVAALDSNVTIIGSTISGNTATSGGGGLVVYATEGNALINSTVTGNTASIGGALITANAGIFVGESTLVDNTAYLGGGLFSEGPGTIDITNSILAGNNDTADGGAPDDLAVSPGGTVSSTYNLIQVINPINVDAGVADGGIDLGAGNILGQDPQLGALADNGGPTETMLPASGSPVINKGDPGFISGGSATEPSTDQRGYARVYGGRIDIGSVEVQPPDAGPSSTGGSDGGHNTTPSTTAKAKGCACNGTSDAALALLTPIGLLLMRRRRRSV